MKSEKPPHSSAVELGEKIFEIASTRNFQTSQFADLLNVNSSYLYKIRDGIRVPSPVFMGRYLQTVKPNPTEIDQLMTPYGELLKQGYGIPKGEPHSQQTKQRIGASRIARSPIQELKQSKTQMNGHERERLEKGAIELEYGIELKIAV